MTAAAAPATDADETVQIVQDMHGFVAGQMTAYPVLGALLLHLFERLCGLRDRLVRFMARIRAGKKPREPAARSAAAGGDAAQRVRKPTLWSRKVRALADLLGADAAPFAERLRAWLAKPESVAFILAHPGIGRTLRPLCRSLGVKLIPQLRLPRRERAPDVGPSAGEDEEGGAAALAAAASSEPPPPAGPQPPPYGTMKDSFVPTEELPMEFWVNRYLVRMGLRPR